MFQTYDPPQGEQDLAERTARLREVLAKSRLDAVLVPRADEHQGEYVAPSAERLRWLTGFSGSAGLAVVARTAAALFVDGRYIAQAPSQVDTRIFEVLQVPDAKLSDWLAKHLRAGASIGLDPWLHTAQAIEDLGASLEPKGIKLKPLTKNPVDRIWGRKRPAPPQNPVFLHPIRYAGKPAEQKISELQAALRKEEQDAVVLTLPDSIAWLLNIRASDVAHNPVALAFAIVPASGKVELFIELAKVGAEVKSSLTKLAKLSRPEALEERIRALKDTSKRIRLDANSAASWFFNKLKGGKARIVRGVDPCLLPKARKNPTEIKGARTAHKRDGIALARFLAWLDRESAQGAVDEIAASRHLETLRSETQALKE